MDIYDIAIIGGGPAGYVAAIHASHFGANVALIEKDKLGGTCLNYGCIPTKTLVRSSELAYELSKASEFGLDIDNYRINFRAIISRKNNVVNQLRKGIEQLITGNKVNFYKGTGRILSPGVIAVNGNEIKARKIIIATGSEATTIPVPGTDLPGVHYTDNILDIEELPKTLVIIGGGNIGAEFACIFSALGTKVTILEKLSSCLQSVDHELLNRFMQILSKRGTDVRTEVSVKGIKREGSMLRVIYDHIDGEHEIECQKVLIATGRRPYTTDLGLSELGMDMDGRCIKVNKYLETNIKGIYAVGDVASKYMLAYIASYEGRTAVENAMNIPKQVDYRAIPNCIFTQPEISYVGITEKEAKTSGMPYKVSKFPLHASERAIVTGETLGIIKLICNAENGQVLGLHILGAHASDLIMQGVIAKQFNIRIEDYINAIPAHPTLSEAIHEAAMGQLTGAIHFH